MYNRGTSHSAAVELWGDAISLTTSKPFPCFSFSSGPKFEPESDISPPPPPTLPISFLQFPPFGKSDANLVASPIPTSNKNLPPPTLDIGTSSSLPQYLRFHHPRIPDTLTKPSSPRPKFISVLLLPLTFDVEASSSLPQYSVSATLVSLSHSTRPTQIPPHSVRKSLPSTISPSPEPEPKIQQEPVTATFHFRPSPRELSA